MTGSGTPTIVTRFAPSPTGLLHLGHAYSALLAWRRARGAGGRFLLRLEDIDATRCRAEFAEAALADLAWLGLDWDEAVRRQSAHFADYRRGRPPLPRGGAGRPLLSSPGGGPAPRSRARPAPPRRPRPPPPRGPPRPPPPRPEKSATPG